MGLFRSVFRKALDGILQLPSIDLQVDPIGPGPDRLGRGRLSSIAIARGDLLGLSGLDE